MTSIGSVSVAKPAKWVVRDAEYRALLAGDIPRFTTKSDEPHLYFDGDRVLNDAFEQTGMEAVRRRVRQLSDDDMRRQQSLIRACLVDRSVMEQTE
jgi:lantibiotic modifying enzyme